MKRGRSRFVLLAFGLMCGAAASVAGSGVLAAGPGSQRIQNVRADADDLSRMRDYAMILRFKRAGLLTPVPLSTRSYYLSGVSSYYRYLRPWAKLFLDRLSRQFHTKFGARLRVTGLVRTASYQRSLSVRNVNAAAAFGDARSSHLTGATLDISKRFMKPSHADWMRRALSGLNDRDVIYAVEEFTQPCFHVMVHRDYEDYVARLGS